MYIVNIYLEICLNYLYLQKKKILDEKNGFFLKKLLILRLIYK